MGIFTKSTEKPLSQYECVQKELEAFRLLYKIGAKVLYLGAEFYIIQNGKIRSFETTMQHYEYSLDKCLTLQRININDALETVDIHGGCFDLVTLIDNKTT
jgi:hypothetical protein